MYDDISDINSTLVVHDDNVSQLAPGLIAAITIASVFVVYLSFMFIVCLAEYCQYINGHKAKPVRHARPQPPVAPTAGDMNTRPQSLLYPDQSTSNSDQRTMSFNSVNSYRISEKYSKGNVKRDALPDTQCTEEVCDSTVTTPAVVHQADIHSIDAAVDKPSPDCLEGCSSAYVTVPSEHDMSILPLISRPRDDSFATDDDGLCETPASNEFQKFEASV